jgi:hypothetical protein
MSNFEQLTKIEHQLAHLTYARAILREATNYFTDIARHRFLPYSAPQITHLLQATDEHLHKAETELEEVVRDTDKEGW